MRLETAKQLDEYLALIDSMCIANSGWSSKEEKIIYEAALQHIKKHTEVAYLRAVVIHAQNRLRDIV